MLLSQAILKEFISLSSIRKKSELDMKIDEVRIKTRVIFKTLKNDPQITIGSKIKTIPIKTLKI